MMFFCAFAQAQTYPPDNTNNNYGNNYSDSLPSGYEYDSHGNPVRKDTSNETLQHRDKYEDSITISFHYWDSTRANKIDSSINDFYSRYPVPWTYYDLGNFGSAAKSFIFQPNMQPGFDAGFHAYDIYKYTLENTKFFQTTRPYSETIYLLGSRGEQMINLFHTQNRKSNLNFGLDFKVISSPGAYKNQSTNTSNGRINVFFQSRNKRYINNFIFITNKVLSSENGGLQPNQNLDSLSFNNPFGASTKLGNNLVTYRSIFGSTIAAGTQYKELKVVMRQSYDFGQKDSVVTDSVTYKLFYPRIRLQHTLEFSSNSYEYHNFLPADSDYYKYLQYAVSSGTDTIRFNDTWQNITNDFAIISYPQKNNLNQFLKLNTGLELIKGESEPFSTDYNNVYVGAEYRNRTRNQLYDVEASGKLYVTGHYAGDYAAYISLRRSLRKNLGSLQLGFQNLNRTPSFVESEYVDSAGLRQAKTAFPALPVGNFNKENIAKVFAVINVPPAGFQLTGEYYLITNYTYFNSLYTSTQSSSLFNVLHIAAEKKLAVTKHLNWYLEGNLQQTTGNPPVNVPLILARSRFAFEGNYFKNLFLSTGLEVIYNTPYKPDEYSPLNGQFFFQDTGKIANRPTVNLYFNFRIKSFKGFVRVENLNTVNLANGFAFTHYNYSAPGYPTRGFWFRLGIWWSFVN
ncbi:MAG: putative porin [Parafilimonas sp.]